MQAEEEDKLREPEFAATITINFVDSVSIETVTDEDDKAEDEDKPEDPDPRQKTGM